MINRVGSWRKSLGSGRGVTLVDGDVWGVAGKAGRGLVSNSGLCGDREWRWGHHRHDRRLVVLCYCIGDGGFGHNARCVFGRFGTVWFVICGDGDAWKSIAGLFLGSFRVGAI